jgi:lipopolysaccharide biosynthesis glycosyltransferase
LLSHDQSLLNLCLEGQIQPLPRKFNTPVSPRRRLLSWEQVHDRVLHLVARPKPWDPLGYLNGQYPHYVQYLEKTDIAGLRSGSILSPGTLFTVARSFRAYAKCFLRR